LQHERDLKGRAFFAARRTPAVAYLALWAIEHGFLPGALLLIPRQPSTLQTGPRSNLPGGKFTIKDLKHQFMSMRL
jgi:hypothetical protein